MGTGDAVAALCRRYGLPFRRMPRIESRHALLEAWRILHFGWRLARWRPDVVLPFTDPANRACTAMRALFGGARVVWNQRDSGLHRGHPCIERLALRRANHLVCNGPEGFAHLRRLVGPAVPIHVIPNGLDRDRSSGQTTDWRHRLGITADTWLVAMVANLHPYKGHRLALQAWHLASMHLQARGLHVMLVCAGRDDGLHAELVAQALRLGIGDRVHFPGAVTDIDSLLAAADATVIASPSEGFPNIAVEAMAAKRVVIGTDLPALRWLLPPMQHAFLARPHPETMAQSLIRAAEDRNIVRACEIANSERSQVFTAKRMAGAFARILLSRGRQVQTQRPPQPPFAFLIPTRDRHDALRRSLPLVQAAAKRVGATIIICDQSTQAFPATPGIQVLHRPDVGGLPTARNVLLRATEAELVCFLDDDTDVAADFAERALTLATQEPDVVAWGPVVETRSRTVRRLHRLAHLGVYADPRRLTGARRDRSTSALFGCCFVVRRAAALAVGFDARRPGYALGEDLDFFLRLKGPKRFATDLRAIHRREGAERADPTARGAAKARFLRWLTARHGGRNPATLVHLGLALVAAASGAGQEPGSLGGVWAGMRATGMRNRW